MAMHRMGVHLIGNREPDFEYIDRLKPKSVKIVDPDPSVLRRVLGRVDNDCVVVLRDHPMSEQKTDMYRQPEVTGIRHAKEWINRLTVGRFKEFHDYENIAVVGINEPDVHNEAEERIVYLYTKAFLATLTQAGVRGLALNLSVGWPRNDAPGQPVIWRTFMPLEEMILEGNHFLCVHEYWYPNPQSGWGWYANRISHCPMSVPIIIGECGYTRQLLRMDIAQPWGWRGNIPPTTYAEQLWYYHDNVDVNVHSIMPFTTGFAGAEWESKDTLPAHADILGRVRQYTFPSVWPVKKGDTPTMSNKDLIIYPKLSRISGHYGKVYDNKFGIYGHEGLDLGFPVGTPVYAPYDGVVAWADPEGKEGTAYGLYCRTYHPELRVCFFFGHMSKLAVGTMNSVKQGQLLGYTGNTGNSSGPHLHLEVRQMTEAGGYQEGWSVHENARLDPLGWLSGWLSAGKKVEYK